MQEFARKVAVITGGASGIGFAMAERFAQEGMRVALADVHQPSLDASAARLRSAGATVLAQQTDVADAASVEALAERVYQEWGAVHVLCNNAGVGLGLGSIWEQPLEGWRWVMGVNLWGIIHGIHAFVPRMLQGGEVGHVVNTASMAGMTIGEAGGGPYSATKHAVVSISESLFGELRRAGAAVSASVLCPGWVDTPIVANSHRDAPSRSGLTGSMAEFPGAFPPSYVAEQVLDGIKEDRFYILAAQSDFLDWMRMRHRRIEDGRNPPVPRSAAEPN
jgi:NAD(P)-dependent dehydrogenase (short-subunit alcohol dehydrogenase family)